MVKRIIYIALGSLVVFGVLFLLWFWVFKNSTQPTQTTGNFGSAGDRTIGQNSGSSGGGNGVTPLGSNASNGTIDLGGTNTSSGGNGSVNIGSGSTTISSGGVNTVSGVQWLAGSGGITGGSGSSVGNGFNPIGINGIDGASIGGTVPTIGGTINSGNSANNGLGLNALAGAAIASIACIPDLFTAGGSLFSGVGVGSASAAASGAVTTSAVVGVASGAPVSDNLTHAYFALATKNQSVQLGLQTTQTGVQTGKANRDFMGCIINGIAKAALQQITISVVNWINSGFNGQPSFVTNYQQFFTNVADLAAGNFIQGSGLAFLCSPFRPQIKIAIAKAYANRSAQSCSLTKIIKNVDSFMNGNFAQGGWGGLVSFTTMPTNNPYGAFAYAQVGLASAQSAALQNARSNITPGGFLGLQQLNCNGQTGINPLAGRNAQAALAGNVVPPGCKVVMTTPGTVIQSSLNKTLGSGVDQLGLANDLDQIISALFNQLMVRTLYNGLTNVSGQSGLQSSYQTPDQVAAQQQAQSILTDMQSKLNFAQQYGTIQQGSISDIETAQNGLNTLENCWLSAAGNSNLTDAQRTQAATTADSASSTLIALNTQITPYNDSITAVNNEIALLEQLQTQALSVSSVADVQALQANYTSLQTSAPFITQTDLTTAQQNRTTLQAQMASTNQLTQTGLAQCNAMIQGH